MKAPSEGTATDLVYRTVWLTLGFIMLAAVLTVCLVPLKAPPVAPVFNDKVLHVLTFVVLTVWFGALFTREHTKIVALGLLLFGVMIEALQSTTAYRSAELLDLVADAGGILIGWVLLRAGLQHWARWFEANLLPEKHS